MFDETLEASGALAIEAQAADWLARKQFWSWNEADDAQLDAWLAQSPAHEIAFWRLQGALARTERLTALRPSRPPRRWLPVLPRVAVAVLMIAALVGAYSLYTPKPKGTPYATSVGGHETIVLADGSRIDLNTDTAIRVSETSGERRIDLEKGEAYFQVVHDASRPLVVISGDGRVTDLGTKFSVRREPDRLVVAVVEGRVNYGAPRVAQPVLLTAGDTMIASANRVTVARKSQHELANELGWRRGIVVFNGTPLADAVREINRYNSRKIALADPKLANVKLTATVSANDPQQFIRMTEYLLGLRAEKADSKFHLLP
jgi:transmembrane sensor